MDVAGTLLFFSARGGGKGRPRRRRGEGDRFFIERPRGGGVSRTGGAEGPGGCPQRIGEFWAGGEAQYVFGGEVFLLAVGVFLLTVELLCLQSLKALMRRTFPL